MRVVLTGASGQLGAYVRERLIAGDHAAVGWGAGLVPVELTDAPATLRALAETDPDVVIHLAAISAADAVRNDLARARAVNVEATARLASWCGERGRRLIYSSTDLVFDGANPWYREDDPAEPLMLYGRTKRDAEPFVRAIPGGLVARISLLFGPSRSPGRSTYLDRTMAALARGEPQTFFEDEFRTALDLATAAEILARLAESDVTGCIHVAGEERVSRYDLMRRVATASGFDPGLVRANRRDPDAAEPRPADVSLDTTWLAAIMPDLRRPTVEEAVAAWRDR